MYLHTEYSMKQNYLEFLETWNYIGQKHFEHTFLQAILFSTY